MFERYLRGEYQHSGNEVILERELSEEYSTNPLRVSHKGERFFMQRNGREVIFTSSSRYVSTAHAPDVWFGYIKGKIEMDNGGVAGVEWTVGGIARRLVVVLDNVNGVDGQYIDQMRSKMLCGHFDLVKRPQPAAHMISKQDLAELEEAIKDNGINVRAVGLSPGIKFPANQVQEQDEIDHGSCACPTSAVDATAPGSDSCDCGATKHGWGHSGWCTSLK